MIVFIMFIILNYQNRILSFQLRVVAKDQGLPEKSSVTYVEVTVLRDSGTLSFSIPTYVVVTSENRIVGSVMTTTVATPGVRVSLTSCFLLKTYVNWHAMHLI